MLRGRSRDEKIKKPEVESGSLLGLMTYTRKLIKKYGTLYTITGGKGDRVGRKLHSGTKTSES